MAILQDHGIEPTVIEYMKNPLSGSEINDLATKLDLQPSGFVRKKEAIVKEIGLDLSDEKAIISAMAEYPVLIERPIVVHGKKAIIGRPPENVKELL